jgi:hypothetical protein
VQVLEWGNKEHIALSGGPFNFVLASDCVYHEEHIEALRRTILALTDPKSVGALSGITPLLWRAILPDWQQSHKLQQ